MKFHLHIVDGNASASSSLSSTTADTTESSAVLLFAHMTLRCGHLADVVTVSASTTPAAVRQEQLLQQAHGASASSGSAAVPRNNNIRSATDATMSEDTKVLRAAGAVLTCAEGMENEAYTLPYAPLAGGKHVAIQPYAYFTTPFAVAEQSLRKAIVEHPFSAPPPYFDLIATTDLTTFEYVLDYYQQLRVRYGGSAMGNRGNGGRGTKPVGVLHVVADDPSRAARVLQRVLEMVLKRSGWALSEDTDAGDGREGEVGTEDAFAAQQQRMDDGSDAEDCFEEEEGNAAAGASGVGGASSAASAVRCTARLDSWVNYVDEAVHLFAQLFGVDVLVALV